MIEWKGEGIILGSKTLGENKAIIFLFTESYGKISGVLRLTKALRLQSINQCGNQITFSYHARLEEHLGTVCLELCKNTLAHFLLDPFKLLAVTTVMALIQEMTPERHPYPALYRALGEFLEALQTRSWLEGYVKLEQKILQEMGFGLKLELCCVTGTKEDLVYVSPRTGRAVSREAGHPYADKLLKLPSFLLGQVEQASGEDILAGLRLLKPFLRRQLTERSYEKIRQGRDSLEKALETGKIL